LCVDADVSESLEMLTRQGDGMAMGDGDSEGNMAMAMTMTMAAHRRTRKWGCRCVAFDEARHGCFYTSLGDKTCTL